MTKQQWKLFHAWHVRALMINYGCPGKLRPQNLIQWRQANLFRKRILPTDLHQHPTSIPPSSISNFWTHISYSNQSDYIHIAKMPPKRVVVQSGRREQEQAGLFGATYKEITNPENATIVRSIVIFSVCWARDEREIVLSKRWHISIGCGCFLPQQFERVPHSSVSFRQHRIIPLHRYLENTLKDNKALLINWLTMYSTL